MKLRHKTVLAALALAAVAAGAAGIARSTATEPIPDADGVIHACYKKPIGEVKIVYSAANCGPGQAPIQWSQTGPQGPKGDPGPQGPAGAAGGSLETFESDQAATDIEIGAAATGIFVTLGGPGRYWVFAKGRVEAQYANPQNRVATADCELDLGFVALDRTYVLVQDRFDEYQVELTLAGIAHATEAGQRLKLLCQNAGQVGELPILLRQPRIYAIKVS